MPILFTENIAIKLGPSNDTTLTLFRQYVFEASFDDVQMHETSFSNYTNFILQAKYALIESHNDRLDFVLNGFQPKLISISVSE